MTTTDTQGHALGALTMSDLLNEGASSSAPRLTPLQAIEASVHESFPTAEPPAEADVAQYLKERLPKMDGGITAALLLAGVIIQGWKLFREEQDRWRGKAAGGPPEFCGECGNRIAEKGKPGCSRPHEG